MQRIWSWLRVLGVSMFCGIILVSIALGAIIPKVINPIAKPLVCSNGNLEITQNTTSYRPGESDTWTTDMCVDSASGQQQDVSLQTTLGAGIIYGLIIFVISMVWGLFSRKDSGDSKAQNKQMA